MKYLVTGASGQLGQKVIAHLATLVPSGDIVALVRSEQAAADYAAKGIETRFGDYDTPETLASAFAGIDRVLLISGSAIGQRVAQHTAAIAAAKAAGVGYLAYTSILRADTSPMMLAAEHKATEDALKASGLSYTILRNGWYLENTLMTLDQDLALGQHFGATADGKLSSATRQDYAEAAAVVLSGQGHDGKTYELASDTGFTLTDYAAAVTAAKCQPVAFVDMPQDAFAAALVGAGLPEGFATVLADSDAQAAKGWLFDDSKTLSRLIGRPTTSLAAALA